MSQTLLRIEACRSLSVNDDGATVGSVPDGAYVRDLGDIARLIGKLGGRNSAKREDRWCG